MAVLHAEDGASVVIEAIGEGAAVSVVNWAEVLSKLAEAGKTQRSPLRSCGGPKGHVGRCRLSR
jgi:PIN domain nuclease of toxin-antitoxin system